MRPRSVCYDAAMDLRPLRLLLLLGAIAMSAAAHAQAWPNKPVKIIVPFAAGGPADLYARAVGEKLQAALGQSLRPGRSQFGSKPTRT